MTQAQRHFKNSFTKTYDKWSDHFFYKSLEVISCQLLNVNLSFIGRNIKLLCCECDVFREPKIDETNSSLRYTYKRRIQIRKNFLLNNQWDGLDAIIENTCFKAVEYVKGGKVLLLRDGVEESGKKVTFECFA